MSPIETRRLYYWLSFIYSKATQRWYVRILGSDWSAQDFGFTMHLASENSGVEKVAAPSVLESQHGSVRPLAAEDLERVAALFLTKFRRRRRHLLDRAIVETAEYMRKIYLDPDGRPGTSNAL